MQRQFADETTHAFSCAFGDVNNDGLNDIWESGLDPATLALYDDVPTDAGFARFVEEYGVSIVGGCCGTTPEFIRQLAEAWDMDRLLRLTDEAVRYGTDNGLPVMYVTEDTIRAAPDDLRQLLAAAVESGATRLCLCDTVGAAVPWAVRNLVTWVASLLDEWGVADTVGIDWHGHRDRGLDLANTLAALEAGATRVHGTALGVGERKL